MKKSILLVFVLSTLLISIGGCVLPPPWPDRDERFDNNEREGREHDRDRGDRHHARGHGRDKDHDNDRDRGDHDQDRGRDYERGRGDNDQNRARDNN
jgi:hypothetical protein